MYIYIYIYTHTHIYIYIYRYKYNPLQPAVGCKSTERDPPGQQERRREGAREYGSYCLCCFACFKYVLFSLCTCIYIYIYIHIYTYTYIYIYIYIHSLFICWLARDTAAVEGWSRRSPGRARSKLTQLTAWLGREILYTSTSWKRFLRLQMC